MNEFPAIVAAATRSFNDFAVALASRPLRCSTSGMTERLLKAVDARIEDLVALTADLIRFPA
ncbi:MAG: hypothetical protein E5V46_22375, partial [Mesorhizobium sp.]